MTLTMHRVSSTFLYYAVYGEAVKAVEIPSSTNLWPSTETDSPMFACQDKTTSS